MNEILETRIPRIFHEQSTEDCPIDAHEKLLDVEPQTPDRFTSAATEVSYLLLRILDRVMRPAPDSAGEARADELSIPNRFKLAHYEMVNDAVAKIRRENFARLGVRHHKTLGRSRFIPAAVNLLEEFEEIFTQVGLKADLRATRWLVEPAALIGGQ